jgi:hypothetical protein
MNARSVLRECKSPGQRLEPNEPRHFPFGSAQKTFEHFSSFVVLIRFR